MARLPTPGVSPRRTHKFQGEFSHGTPALAARRPLHYIFHGGKIFHGERDICETAVLAARWPRLPLRCKDVREAKDERTNQQTDRHRRVNPSRFEAATFKSSATLYHRDLQIGIRRIIQNLTDLFACITPGKIDKS